MTTDYFNQQFNQGLDYFAKLRENLATSGKWGMKQYTDHYEQSAGLFLYLNAITNYDPIAVFNFLTEDQVYFIINQIRTLTGIANVDTISEKNNQFT